MSDLQNQTPADTYKGLLQVGDYTNGVDGTAKYVSDGEGIDSALSVSTTKVGVATNNPQASLHILGNLGAPTTSNLITRFGQTSGSGMCDLGFMGVGPNLGATWIQSRDSSNTNKYYLSLNPEGGNVGIGVESPSAPLEVASTTGGVIMPRMNENQRDAISSPTDGEMIYNTTTNKFQGRANGAWVDLH